MVVNITKDLTLTQDEADKILKIAYLKGYFDKCEDVTNGCDIHRYIPNKKIVEFHIKDPMFWVELKLEQVILCQIELLNRKNHIKRRKDV